MTKLIVAFRNFVKAPKNEEHLGGVTNYMRDYKNLLVDSFLLEASQSLRHTTLSRTPLDE
jgi:hypothetical protein